MISEDEYLERIVAGVHAATSRDADVRWNEVINGRQFDVAVRFELGTLAYLVLVEVKNRTRKAAAADVEAFVTKARDQNASKAVFVTAAGFQSGAIEVARRHGIELFTVSFDSEEAGLQDTASFFSLARGGLVDANEIGLSLGEPEPGIAIEAVTLVYGDDRRAHLPADPSQMTYYARKTRLKDGRSLEDLILAEPIAVGEVGTNERRRIALAREQRIEPPDAHFFPTGKIKAVEFVAATRLGRTAVGELRVEPTAVACPVVYTNVLTGQTKRFALHELPIGIEAPKAGGFYCLFHPLRYYYCAALQGDLITWWLVESFQNGHKISLVFTQALEFGRHYVPVSDRQTLRRLRLRLQEFTKLSGNTVPQRRCRSAGH